MPRLTLAGLCWFVAAVTAVACNCGGEFEQEYQALCARAGGPGCTDAGVDGGSGGGANDPGGARGYALPLRLIDGSEGQWWCHRLDFSQ